MPNFLDNVIGYLAPSWGAARARDRRMISAWSETSNDRRGGSRLDTKWQLLPPRPLGGTVAEQMGLRQDRARAKKVDDENGIASAILDRATENVIGVGIDIHPTTSSPEFNAEATARFEAWKKVCDVRGRMNWGAMQRMAYRCRLRDGDNATLLVSDPNNESRLQLVGADHISNKHYAANLIQGSTTQADGVTVNESGRPVSFSIETTSIMGTQSWQEVDAKDVVFIARLLDPDDVRGITAFRHNFSLLDQLDGYIEASVVGARVAACQTMVIKKHNAAQTLGALGQGGRGADGRNQRLKQMEPGMVWYLEPDEDAQAVNPTQPTQQFPDFVAALARFLGLTFGITLEQVMLDFSRTNYSSARAARLQANQTAEQEQDDFSTHWASRIYYWWLCREIKYRPFKAALPNDYGAHETVPQGKPWVDPTKEIDCAIREVNELGTNAKSLVAKEKGYSFARLCQIRAEDNQTEISAGLLPAGPGKQNVTVDENGKLAVMGATKGASDGATKGSALGAQNSAPLNGAQIAAAVDVIVKLRDKTLTDAAAIGLLDAIGIADAKTIVAGISAIQGGTGDTEFKRQILLALLAMPAAREAVYNGTDVGNLIISTGLMPEKGYVAPYIPVVAPAGPLVSGDTTVDPAGDVVGGAVGKTMQSAGDAKAAEELKHREHRDAGGESQS